MKKFALLLLPLFLMAQEDPLKPNNNPELMVIKPEERSKDLKAAYDFAQKHKLPGEVVFVLKNGKELRGINSIEVLPGGTMMIFNVTASQGQTYVAIGVEDIVGVAIP
ncbi:MAG: hypothetical protein MRY21_00525 [Simkaniaceae bacterium]|nr:hypothetical protein [Simkaniaceae bacterium]